MSFKSHIVDKEMPITTDLVMEHLEKSHTLGTKILINSEQVPRHGRNLLLVHFREGKPPFVIQNKSRRYLKSCTVRCLNRQPIVFIYTLDI